MTNLQKEPSLRERLGGRWAISWQAYAITAPLAVLILVVGSARTPEQAFGWFIAGVTAVAVVGAWVYLTHRTLFRNRAERPLAVPVSIGFAAFASAIYIGVSAAVGIVMGLPIDGGPLSRIIPTLIVATWWTIALALALEARWRFGKERDALIERAVGQQLANMQEADVIRRVRESLRQDLATKLAESRLRIEHHLEAIEAQAINSFSLVADDLRDTARDTIRPLSHTLAQQTGRVFRKPGLFSVLLNIINRQPFRPVIVSLVYAVTTAPREIERLGWQGGVSWVVVTVALIFITMSAANLAMRRWPQHHAVLFLGGIALIQAPSLALADVYSELTGIYLSTEQILVSVLLGILVIIVTSGFGSLRATRQDLLRSFARDIDQDEIAIIARGTAIAEAAREVAGALHGSVQTKLVACAMTIDHAAETGDIISINQALVQARAILEKPIPELTGPSTASLIDQVERKAALWKGLVEVATWVDPALRPITGPTAACVAELVEEGIANAVQHGSASAIDVNIHAEDSCVVVDITDNGRGMSGGSAGLGSRLLDERAPGWTLTRQGDQTCLSAKLGPKEIGRIPSGLWA